MLLSATLLLLLQPVVQARSMPSITQTMVLIIVSLKNYERVSNIPRPGHAAGHNRWYSTAPPLNLPPEIIQSGMYGCGEKEAFKESIFGLQAGAGRGIIYTSSQLCGSF
jgi:hypothetical protein